jgi:glyoxylase-like metal-dependent hydrolase (beta-lactamase superfamily II)
VAHIHPDHSASAGVARDAGLTPTSETHQDERIWRRAAKHADEPPIHTSAPRSHWPEIMQQLGSPLPAADHALEEGLPRARSGSQPDLQPKRSGICPNRDQSP